MAARSFKNLSGCRHAVATQTYQCESGDAVLTSPKLVTHLQGRSPERATRKNHLDGGKTGSEAWQGNLECPATPPAACSA